jgi:diaminobutyrate-2-oxoglutarate transaminase
MNTETFHKHESEVRSYCRAFPTVFTTASGSELTDEEGRTYLDFFGGAGALNYGHNNERLRDALLDYIRQGGVTHTLDLHTSAKRSFIQRFHDLILKPRGMDHKLAFPGPTGTNAVELALKLARKHTGRSQVVAFTNGFHGMTLGALAVTGNASKRRGAGIPLHDTTHLPFFGDLGGPGGCGTCTLRPQSDRCCTLDVLERQLSNPSSGLDKPAAVIVEVVQGEGGVRPASDDWLRGVREITREHGVLMIVDDIQAGCGRTGHFFSFEPSGIVPDMVTLSKSLSGYGLPMALVLVRPEFDVMAPGEHNGTFRGFNHGFVTATAALEAFWQDDAFAASVREKGQLVHEGLARIARRHEGLAVRGRGLMQGLVFANPDHADEVSAACFERGLIIETSGPRGEVVKVLCPLTTTAEQLTRGLDILAEAVAEVVAPASQPETNGVGVHA